ncbi:MAG: efflux RND transporter periplasmic adaptor subunit [Alcaligenaceae bacterium]|nr:efflux RND transporter periplasmic adaptor subunit [Alcaligenaceae bacterium]
MSYPYLPEWRTTRAVLLAAVVLLSACSEKPAADAQGMKVPVSVIELQPKPTTIYTELPGRVEAVEDAQIRARVTGIVTAIEFEQGSVVEEGELLFTIDPAPYKAARDQAAAQLKNAQASARTAKLQADRFTKLVKMHAVSRQDYDNAVAQAQQTAAAVAAAKAALESAEINLGYTHVTTPISGQTGKSMVTVGALVSATQATQMATVQRFDEVYVDVTQSTAEISDMRRRIAQGTLEQDEHGDTPAQVLLEDGHVYAHPGKLLFSGMMVDPGTSQVTLRSLFPNPDQILLPGMYVRVRIAQGTDPKALIVPEQAIQRSVDGGSNVVVVRDGKAAFIPVSVGPSVSDGFIIYDGLKAGDQLVVEGFQKLRPGAPVQAMPWKPGDAQAGSAEGADTTPGTPTAKPDADSK